jgi:hypothetical protein
MSLLLPSRRRPQNVARLYKSATATAEGHFEMVVYLDDDDPTREQYPLADNIRYITGPRIVLSEMWNRCYEQAEGPYYMHCGDDIIFRTPGWDTKVIGAFPPDKIAFVFGYDGLHPPGSFGTHGWVHKKWVDAVGYFVPSHFSSDYNDTWLNEVAMRIGRWVHVDVYTEHMHFMNNKGPLDVTHQERLDRHRRDNVEAIWARTEPERIVDAKKLVEAMQV